MSDFLAVEGMTLEFDDSGHSGTITITTPASTKVKADGKGVYKNLTVVTITGGSDGAITNATGSGVLNATATKVKVEGLAALRNGDQTLPITMTGTNPSPPPPTDTYTTIVKISDAGQTVVKGK